MRMLPVALLVALVGCTSVYRPAGMKEAIKKGPDSFLERAVVGPQGDGTYVVATTQIIDPAGRTTAFRGRPTDLALNSDESLLAIKNMRDITLYDMATHKIVQVLRMPKAGNSFTGIAWSRDDTTIWTTDAEDHLRAATRQAGGSFEWSRAIKLPGPGGRGDPAPGGFALDEDHGVIYVFDADEV